MSDQPTNLAFTHLDAAGSARMVDISPKAVTVRRAIASALCHMSAKTAQAIRENQLAKGDVLQVARLAAIGAAKRTDELIPLCHSLGLDQVATRFDWVADDQLKIYAEVQATARTGVEMEALVAASIAALTVYDMCKSQDKAMRVSLVQLEHKSGGSSGDFNRAIED